MFQDHSGGMLFVFGISPGTEDAPEKNIIHKTLYSARHSFVTTLINKGVPPERVSELVGHSHKTMKMGTYFAGYSTNQLKTDVELL